MASQKNTTKYRVRKPGESTPEVDITDPKFLQKLSKTRLGDDSDPIPSDAFRVGGWKAIGHPQHFSKTRHYSDLSW